MVIFRARQGFAGARRHAKPIQETLELHNASLPIVRRRCDFVIALFNL